MTLPPERITVKRRRDEDPVEALYIQSKKQRPGIFWKLQSRPDGQHQFAQESSTEVTRKDSGTPTSNGAASSVVPRTSKNDETPVENRKPFAEHGSSKTANLSCTSRAADVGTKAPNFLLVRRYHLTHDSYPRLKRQPSFSGSIKKRQRHQKDDLAVFVETARKEELIQRTIRERSGTRLDKIEDLESQANVNRTVRKRPNVNVAERAWRSEAWGKQSTVPGKVEPEKKNQPATSWNAESMEIAQELQQMVVEQSQIAPQLPPKTALKFKPKPPGLRRTTETRMAKDALSTPATPDNLEEDGDYIFDTYIRAPFQTSGVDVDFGTEVDPMDNMDIDKVGILVIEEDQEKLWEDYGDEELSEAEFESDEEDENAEDYYGNDYPEDEVDADDEYGRGSYNYRIHASDNEEYDGDEAEWSDAEDKLYHRR